MPFLQFLFSPQAHKFRNGYFINHDTLLAVDPEIRQKLIFYFIAEQVPQKLSREDWNVYEQERQSKIELPRTIWMTAALVGPLALALIRRKAKLNDIRSVGLYSIMGGILTPFAGTIYTRCFEGRFVESSQIIDQLSKKYQFGVYDFAQAKKQSHVLQLLYTLDAPYGTLHSQA